MPLLGQTLTSFYVQNFRLPAHTSDFGYGHLLIFYLFGAEGRGGGGATLGCPCSLVIASSPVKAADQSDLDSSESFIFRNESAEEGARLCMWTLSAQVMIKGGIGYHCFE